MNRAMKDKSRLVLIYTDGSHEQFEFPPQFEKAKMSSILQKLMGSAVLSLQLEDRLIVIPTANIRSAELSPVPLNLPETVVRNVERVP